MSLTPLLITNGDAGLGKRMRRRYSLTSAAARLRGTSQVIAGLQIGMICASQPRGLDDPLAVAVRWIRRVRTIEPGDPALQVMAWRWVMILARACMWAQSAASPGQLARIAVSWRLSSLVMPLGRPQSSWLAFLAWEARARGGRLLVVGNGSGWSRTREYPPVEEHAGHVLAKVGAAGRTEAVAAPDSST
jgi:hypothetical protein